MRSRGRGVVVVVVDVGGRGSGSVEKRGVDEAVHFAPHTFSRNGTYPTANLGESPLICLVLCTLYSVSLWPHVWSTQSDLYTFKA